MELFELGYLLSTPEKKKGQNSSPFGEHKLPMQLLYSTVNFYTEIAQREAR